MRRNYFLLIVIISVLNFTAIALILKGDKKYSVISTSQVAINGQEFDVEMAKTEAERDNGLMHRDHLDADSGMLFVFPASDIYTFWMKNTSIPLDIIWINDSKIVDMTTLSPPDGSNIPQYTPKNKADYVLELNAGIISKYNFQLGDRVSFST